VSKRIRLSFIFIWVFWIVFIGYIFVGYNDDNPIKIKYPGFDKKVRLFLPEGWAFFSKSPRDDYMQIYENSNGHLIEIKGQRHGALSNLLGLKRTSRSMSVEYSYLLSKVKTKVEWSECNDNIDSFIAKNVVKPVDVINKTRSPILCGKYYIAQYKVIPWAWANNYENVQLPCKLTLLNVICVNP